MLVSMTQALQSAVDGGYAIGSFNATGLEAVQAIVGAAQRAQRAVILNFAEVHSPYVCMEEIAPIMLWYAAHANVPVCVHLDHGSSQAACRKAIELGFTSVMLDASAAPYADNVAQTAQIVRLAHSVGVSVEAELGAIGADSAAYTDPATAEDFVAQTGVDALAIAFGTSHGVYAVRPVLDLDRISSIRARVNVPLVMHGGSGLSRAEFQTAIRNGIRKVNYYTYMAIAGGSAVKAAMDKADGNVFFHDIAVLGRKAMEEDVYRAIQIFALQEA